MGGTPDSDARRRTAGFSLLSAAIGVALSAVAFSGVYAVVNSPTSDESPLRVRVELRLEADRTMRALSDLLIDSVSLGTPGPGRMFDYRQGPDSYSIVLEGDEIRAGRLGLPSSQRAVGRHVESLEIVPDGPGRIRIHAGFRRVVERKVYTCRETCTVRLGAADNE